MTILQKLAQIWDTIIGKFSVSDSLYMKVDFNFPQEMTIKSRGENLPTSPEEITMNSLKPKVFQAFKAHIKLREGEVVDKSTGKHIVYKDSLGKPTVGWGHLVRPEDKLTVGELVEEERVEEFFYNDSKWALDAAYSQAEDLGHKTNKDFIVALASVNYQLGSGWVHDFKNTYAHIKNKRYNNAIKNLRRSKWNQQTPVRVEDFIKALAKL